MGKPILLLLGGNKLNLGVMKKFQGKGYRVFVIDWNENPNLIGDRHYQIDVKDSGTIIDTLQRDGVWEDVSFAYSSIDLAVKSVAMINRRIGLKTISDEGLRYSTSKSRMTKRWAEVGLLNRISKCYNAYDEEVFQLNSAMKLIIKPDNSASSRGITILERNSAEIIVKCAFEKALNEASDKIVVVEEFIEGIEYTVEMLGDSYGNVSVFGISKKTHTVNTNRNKIAVKLHYNSINDELQKQIAEYGIKCYQALGFSASLGHLEILMRNDGSFSPIEIGARSSGFIASDLVDIVSGEDYLGKLIEVQKGERVESGFHPQSDMASMYFFYDFPEGARIVKEKSLLDFCDNCIKSRYFDRECISLGKSFGVIDNDNARVGYEILEGDKSIMTNDYIEHKEKEMLREIIIT